jgi:translocator protein
MAYIPSLTLPSLIFATPAYSILVPIAAGTSIGMLTRPTKDQKTYHALKQPPYRPPPAVFTPTWIALYGLMGYAAHRAWTTGMASAAPAIVEDTRRGATLYTIQLGLNLAFMPLFYGQGWPVPALVDIVGLTATVAYLTSIWARIDATATYCLLPYLAWLGYASYLCAGTGYLNAWNFHDKEKRMETKAGETKFVDEEPEGGSLDV